MNLSLQGLKILRAFLVAGTPLSGSDICRTTHLTQGTLYPLLWRFEQAGTLTGQWESSPEVLGRPRRRVYRLTKRGKEFAMAVLQEVQM